MKQLVIILITAYQTIIAPLGKQLFGITASCRFSPTCSRYTKEMIQEYGVIKGLQRGLTQLAHCHPFTRYEYL